MKYLIPSRPVGQDFEYSPIVKAQGIHLIDQDNRRYLDFNSGIWNCPFGYSNPLIEESIMESLKTLCFVNTLDFKIPMYEEYASKLLTYLPENTRAIGLTISGSESIEYAIKIARSYQAAKGNSRREILVFENSYHGTTYAAMTAGGLCHPVIEDLKPLVGGITAIKSPTVIVESSQENVEFIEEYIDYLEGLIESKKNQMAAILLEPVIASGGIFKIPNQVAKRINELAKEHDFIVICDEVATGFGRTGYMFGFELTGLKPDLICFSKGINNGVLPMGAISVNETIYNKLESDNVSIEHFSTQDGNPQCVASALATLKLFDEKLLETIRDKSSYLESLLREELSEVHCVNSIRCYGLMIGIDIVDRHKKYINESQLDSLFKEIRKKGLITYRYYVPDICSGLSLFVPYIAEREDLQQAVKILKRILSKQLF